MVDRLERPTWIRAKSSDSDGFRETLRIIRDSNIHTVCEESLCPNIGECWRNKTATFLIMGGICTRKCGFCNIKTGVPLALEPLEPKNIAKSIKELGIKYVVITSVTRDDLPDGGAKHFAEVIVEIREQNPDVKIEILTPDFQKNFDSIKVVAEAKPDVFGHNIEIVKRLHNKVKRAPADYNISVNILKWIKEQYPDITTKTGMMVGVGEKIEEVFEVIKDLVDAKVDILTIGQYLTPSTDHYPVVRYVTPDEFEEFKRVGEELGIKSVISGPLVRSSYKAGEAFNGICKSRL